MKTGNLTGLPHITKGNIEKVDIVKNDLKGQKFGRLIVKERIGSDKHKKIFWKCVCVCGNISKGSVEVSWSKQHQKYQAAITVNGKSINLGRYKALTDAIEARKNGEQEYWG